MKIQNNFMEVITMKANDTINILGLAVILGLSLMGCSDKTNDNPTSTPQSTVENSSVGSAAENVDTSTSEPESKLSEEQLKLVSALKHQSFIAPDGEEVKAEEADYVFDSTGDYIKDGSSGTKFYIGNECNGNITDMEIVQTVLRYNFAYIRYCRPFFYAGEVLNESESEELLNSIGDVEWFKVKAGDKLDCGLTVKKALYERIPTNYGEQTIDNYIEFDGDITLEGVLYTANNPNDYLTKPGDLIFVPDPTKTSGLPTSAIRFDNNYIYYGMGLTPDSEIEYVMSDVGYLGWTIGKADDLDNKDAIFGSGEYAHVKATLTNIKFSGDVNSEMPTMSAEIVDIERMD